jgi:hypothetical protein
MRNYTFMLTLLVNGWKKSQFIVKKRSLYIIQHKGKKWTIGRKLVGKNPSI